MIHVCYCLFDKTGHYSKFVGTSMLSIFENTLSPVTVHIVHDNTLSTENLDRFALVAARYNQTLELHNVEKICPEKIEEIKKLQRRAMTTRFTIGAYYRFFIPHIFPPEIEKVIYLDSDTIVNLDIAEYWKIDLGDKVMGVVTTHSQKLDPPADDDLYDFNSGSLLMNMQVLRDEDENLNNSIRFLAEKTNGLGLDQDILNHCFQKKTLHIPRKFNRLVKWDRKQGILWAEEKIYHYAHDDSTRGLGMDTKDPFDRLWINYFLKTPWFNEDLIQNIYKGFMQMREEIEDNVIQLSSIMQGRKRVFFFEFTKIKTMTKHFSIRDDEEIIIAENNESVEKLVDFMKKSAGKIVVFVITGGWFKQKFKEKYVADRLVKEGFINGRDFLNGWDFLSASRGAHFNSLPLIKAI